MHPFSWGEHYIYCNIIIHTRCSVISSVPPQIYVFLQSVDRKAEKNGLYSRAALHESRCVSCAEGKSRGLYSFYSRTYYFTNKGVYGAWAGVEKKPNGLLGRRISSPRGGASGEPAQSDARKRETYNSSESTLRNCSPRLRRARPAVFRQASNKLGVAIGFSNAEPI